MFVLVLCAILLIWVIWVHNQTDSFQNPPIPTIDPTLVTNYQRFVSTIYNPFLITWQRAIVSSISADQPQQPLTDPSQSSSSATPTIPPQSEMNAYIANLSQKLGKPLPNITDPLPETIDLTTFPVIAPKIPTDPTPYTNALLWLNAKMEEAHAKLQSALKGESFTNLEGFDNQTCQDLSQCFNDNPQFAEQIEAALQSRQKKTQQQVSDQLKKFMADPSLTKALQTNKQLVAKSKEVENQAQSGELLNQMDLPKEEEIKYTLPEGSDKLQKMNYAQQQAVKKASPTMFSLKTLMDQINSNLR